mmetsp:Transcript_20377/g.23490  ORF Transcript_20377/g.23490 Transcript_20377/m.23490 type:complete len:83 (-) Transcript_20377:210-458(-)
MSHRSCLWIQELPSESVEEAVGAAPQHGETTHQEQDRGLSPTDPSLTIRTRTRTESPSRPLPMTNVDVFDDATHPPAQEADN